VDELGLGGMRVEQIRTFLRGVLITTDLTPRPPLRKRRGEKQRTFDLPLSACGEGKQQISRPPLCLRRGGLRGKVRNVTEKLCFLAEKGLIIKICPESSDNLLHGEGLFCISLTLNTIRPRGA